jgi:hypothetical protein
MIAPVRLIQAFIDRETLNVELRLTFGMLYPLVFILLFKEVRDTHGDYSVMARQLLTEWESCRCSRTFWSRLEVPREGA